MKCPSGLPEHTHSSPIKWLLWNWPEQSASETFFFLFLAFVSVDQCVWSCSMFIFFLCYLSETIEIIHYTTAYTGEVCEMTELDLIDLCRLP